MEIFEIRNVSFAYPDSDKNVLSDINLTVRKGEFITVCGKSGCGKTTLLRLLKPLISPHGALTGEIFYKGSLLSSLGARQQGAEIGYVMQNPESQIVTDKVYSELAFGLESLGYATAEIRTRVSEIASFFGLQERFYEKTSNLSGGQKQLLNLASIMVMQPEVLIFDEPTSQLDPIAASEFLNNIKRINEEFGTTVVLAEHRLEEAFALSDRVVVMDEGRLAVCGTPHEVGRTLAEKENDMFNALPVPTRVFASLEDFEGTLPITVREGKWCLQEYVKSHEFTKCEEKQGNEDKETVLSAKGVFFRYERDLPDVIKNFGIDVCRGEIYTVLGDNATGKSTAVSLLAGIRKPQYGEIRFNGRNLTDLTDVHGRGIGLLPQNPCSIFSKKRVCLCLLDMTDKKCSEDARWREIRKIAKLCRIENLLDRHPYDLSGGEQERVALSMVLLKNPQILILDEPTKGMDASFKNLFAEILFALKRSGITILMVSHDIEFAAEVSDRCALMFDGCITSSGNAREFFCGNTFYTTVANKMAREILPDAVLAEDIIKSLGGKVREKNTVIDDVYEMKDDEEVPKKKEKLSLKRIISGSVFALACAAVCVLNSSEIIVSRVGAYILQTLSIFFAALSVSSFFPQEEIKTERMQRDNAKKSGTIVSAALLLIIIPVTVLFGVWFFEGRKYYLTSLLIVAEVLASLFFAFERRKPKAREVVIVSVMIAIAVAGRGAFFMVPQFKPVAALVIISGVCFGGEVGFLVGAMSAFVSNFFFGQGPWTPWQMFAFGIIGFIAGILFETGVFRKTRLSLSVFGFFSTLVIYGVIMNISSVLTVYSEPTREMLATALAAGVFVDLIHAASSAFFLWVIALPMIESLERIKKKYGLIEK